MAKFLKMIKNDKGATAIEYGLIAALIAVAAIGAMTSLGTSLSATSAKSAPRCNQRLLRKKAAVPKGAAVFLCPPALTFAACSGRSRGW